jgi:hypothetical protein
MDDHDEVPSTDHSFPNHRLRVVRQRSTAAVFALGAILTFALLTACGTSGDDSKAPSPSEPSSELVGTWTGSVTKEDLVRVVPDFPKEHLCDNAGRFDWTFNADGTFEIDQTALQGCPEPEVTHIEDRWSVDGNRVTFTSEQEVYEWSVEGDELTFTHVSGRCVPCKAINTANSWKRVG